MCQVHIKKSSRFRSTVMKRVLYFTILSFNALMSIKCDNELAMKTLPLFSNETFLC